VKVGGKGYNALLPLYDGINTNYILIQSKKECQVLDSEARIIHRFSTGHDQTFA
jgi:hypothetical protein